MFRDLRYALRTLRSAPGFAVTVVLTLGIGLGLNTTLFTLFNAYVLHPFAVRDPHTLYQISWATARNEQSAVSWEQYQDIHQSPIFSDALAFSPFLARVESRNLQGLSVSGNYFTMLGVGAALGRPILEKDVSTPGANAVAVLSHQLWKAAFAGDPGIIGRTIRISGQPFEVIGVSPADFFGIAELPMDFFIPITMQSAVVPGPDLFGPDKPRGVQVIGRVRKGASLQSAQAALTVWIKHRTETDKSERAIQAKLTSRATPFSLDSELLVVFIPLLVVFGLVMVTCCANVSNMMLARALGRQREIGVRLAMGAQRARLIRQLLSENVLLSLLAGAVGLAVSNAAIGGAQRLLTATLPAAVMSILHIAPLDPDYRVFMFILAAAGVSTIGFGLAPALQATRTSLVEALRGEFGARVSSSKLRSTLVVSQISVCVILLVPAGILLRGSTAYQHTDVGYNTHGIVYPLFIGRGSEASEIRKLAERLSTAPWVDQWAAAWRPPLYSLAQIPVTTAQGTQWIQASYNLVSPEYFRVLDIPILRGRNFSKAEAEAEASVAIVSQATAKKFWPNENGLRKSIVLDRKALPPGNTPRADHAVIIGIAKTVSSGNLLQGGPDPTMIYFPTSPNAKRAMTFLIRGKGTVSTATRQLEGALEATIPNRPAISISLDEMFLTQAYPFLAAAWIAAMLGALALLLALSGMYGVLSYLVGQRTKEIGIRIALGATPGVVVRLILSESLRFAALGVGMGMALAFGGSLLLRHLITRINVYDGVPYAAGSLAVMLVALTAAFFPSSRAARINPVETLRAE